MGAFKPPLDALCICQLDLCICQLDSGYRLESFLPRALFESNVRCPTSIVSSRPSRSRTLNVTAAPSQRAPSLKGLLSPGKKRYGL